MKKDAKRKGSAVDRPVKGGTGRIPPAAKRGTAGRKRTGQAAEQGMLLQQILDTASVAIFLVDKSGRITHANQRMSEMFRCPMGELIGSEYVSHVHPSEREIGRQKMLALLESEIPSVDLERFYWRKDGSEFWGHLAGKRFHDDHGNEIGIIGVITDIDKRKMMEMTLRESEEKFRALVETSYDWIWEVDERGVYTYASPRVQNILGYAAEEVVGRTPFDFMPPDERASVAARFREVIATREPLVGLENTNLRKDGKVVILETSGMPIFDTAGAFKGYRGIDRDITGRKQADEKLRESENRTRSIIESIPVGLHRYRLEPDGRLVFIGANPAADRILGVDNSSFIGKTIEEAFPSLADTEVPQRYREVVATGQTWQTESIEYRDNAIEGAFEVHAFRTGPDTMVAAFEDITERKQAEMALKEREVKYRRLYNETPVLLHSISRDGTLVEVNDYWLKTLQYERHEVIGRKVTDFYTPESRKYAEESVQPAFFRDGIIQDISFQFIKKNGEVIEALLSATGERDAGGRIVRSQAVIEDVTERKRAEAELRESEEKFSKIFQKAPLLITLTDVGTGRFFDVNERFLEVSGYTRDEVLGRTSVEIGWSSKEERARMVKDLRDRGGVAGMELSLRRKDGKEVICLFHGERITVGGAERLLGIAQDITERKRAERQLAESQTMLRNVIDAIPVRVFWKDRESRYLGCNMLFAQDAGRPDPDTLLGEDDFTMAWAEQAESYRADDSEVMRTGIPKINYEEPQTTPTGDRIWLRTSKIPLRDEGGAIYGVLGTYEDITERKRTESALRESEEQYRRLVQAANSVILTWDTTGNILFMNEFGERFFGYGREELIGRNVVGTIVPEQETSGRDLARLMQEIQKAPDQFMDNENENITKDGTRVWIRWANKAITDQQGNLVGILSVGNDITRRKRAEEALQRSERMLQTIIDAEPECVKLLDKDANLIMMNRAGLDMIQVESLEQVKGRCVCTMVGTGDRDAFMDLTRRIFQGESGTLAFEMVGAKGRRLWLETHAVPLRNEKDEIVALLGVTRDVTAKRQADEALRASESRFRTIIEHASSGILVAETGTGRFRYANPEICRMLGYESDELLQLAVDAIHPADELPLVRRTFAAGTGVQTSCLRRDGTVFPVEIRTVGVELDGRPCLIGFFTDITEKRLLEEERVKTEKLESIGMLAGGIAHDFNNLLQGVFGYISIAKMTVDRRDEALAMLGQAEKALHQTVNLTSQLLTFSKGGKPVKKLIDLRHVIETAAAFSLSGSRTGYHFTADDGLWSVEADEGQIGQVVQNIVLNADQAMPEGGVVRIFARNIPEGDPGSPQGMGRGNYVAFSISDSGIGIPAEYQTKIFDPYFTTKEKGSGLGLATSYSIIRNHGGLISVRSTPGSGTTFTLYLPAAAARVAREQDRPVPASGRPGRVLVMDDEEVVRRVAQELIQALGHDVEAAEHGEQAIKLYQEARAAGRPFDVVILDLTIRGGMGGSETIEKLLAIDPEVKAVVSSGYSDDTVISRYPEKGFRAFLKKPYDIAALQSILNDLIT